jgi:DDE superfamily endonuclease
MWCVAELSPQYIRTMEDVLALYEKPHNAREPVVCLDEKPVSLHRELRPPIPAKPGSPAKRDNEYERRGTANVFGVVEPKAGRHFTRATTDRCGRQFARLIEYLTRRYSTADTIHLVMDNLNTHSLKSLIGCFGEEQGRRLWNRFTVHYTPKHGSWLNQAEIELSLYSRGCLGTRMFSDLTSLQQETRIWNRQTNRRRTRINWTFTRRRARKTFRYRTPRI